MDLLLGCGSNKTKKVSTNGNFDWKDLTTVDHNSQHNPDVIWDLEKLPLPFNDNSIDEIHIYEVLEHCGHQGDYKFFFAQFEDFYRMLKPNGYVVGTCPRWDKKWATGDPSHTRIIQRENFHYLNQQNYKNEIGITAMTDFRYLYSADFIETYYQEYEYTFAFILQAIKPSRK